MRAFLALTLVVAVVSADEREEVLALVERLGSRLVEERTAANRRLVAMGDRIAPILRELSPADPEVRRFLRVLLRQTRRLRLVVVPPLERHAIGSPLRLEVHLINETEDTYVPSLVHNSRRGNGTKSVFLLRLEKGVVSLKPDQVEIITKMDNPPILRPGQMMRVAIRLEGEDSPLRRPGKLKVVVGFESNQLVKYVGDPRRPEELEQEMVRAHIDAAPITLEAYGSKPEALAGALQGKDKKKRDAALAELRLRNDAVALPLLRRFADDPDLRLAAIRRLGEAANVVDLKLIRNATKDPRKDVRVAAVHALGHFKHRRARSRLLVLASDYELRAAAVHALMKHRHPSTIDAFVRALAVNTGEAWVQDIQKTLYDWTGKHVSNRRGEIAAFERWWIKNRQAWTRKLQGR